MKLFKSIVLFLGFLCLAGILTACSGTQEITAKNVKDERALKLLFMRPESIWRMTMNKP